MLWINGGDAFLVALLALFNPTVADALAVQFGHVAWNGFHFEDLIFPLFLFIAGLSIPFSITKRLERGDDRKDIYKHILKRAVLLFLLGQAYNNINLLFTLDFADWRIMGVLQRIGICYFIASLIAMKVPPKGQAAAMIAILLGYWAVMMLVPVPGVGAGVLTPEGNLASYIDRQILPGAYCCFPLGDNEGLLSTVPAVATALLGALAGHWLRTSRSQKTQVRGLLGAGGTCLGVALLWNLTFPINKILWTSSYMLFAGGWSLLLLAFFFWVIDVRGHQKWAFFFIVIGMNSIFIYLFGSLVDFGFIGNFWTNAFEPLIVVTLAITVRWLVLYFMYLKKWFFKV